MTPQDTAADALVTFLTAAYLDARHVGDGAVLVEGDDVVANVSADGLTVDVALIVRDEDGAPVDEKGYGDALPLTDLDAVRDAIVLACAVLPD
jgi:hypothetical protein